ncbi:hypothetical protein C8Q78DRAFT_529646 [Trametes maxima]|nr:hypothetical protein C8Q78DRAFT_529646 [Trametes maxima]
MIFPSAALLLTWTIALLGVLKPHAVDTLFSTLAHVNILTLPSVATFVQVASRSVMRLALEPPTLGDALTNQPHIPFHPTATSRSHPALSSTFFDPRVPQHFGEHSFWPRLASMFAVFALVCSVIAASVVAPYVLMLSWSKLPQDVQDLLLGTPIGSRFELPQCPHSNPLHDPATIQLPPPCHEDILSSPRHFTWFLASPTLFDSHSDLIPPPPTPEVQPGSPDPAVLVSHSASSLSDIAPDLTDDDSEDDSEDESCTHPYEARFNYFRSLPDGEEEEAMEFYEARHNYFMSIPEDEQAALWEGLELLEQLVAMTDREFAEYLESQDADSLEKFMLLLAFGNWFVDYVCGRRPEGEERWVFPEELWYFRWIEIINVESESPRSPESWLWNSWD